MIRILEIIIQDIMKKLTRIFTLALLCWVLVANMAVFATGSSVPAATAKPNPLAFRTFNKDMGIDIVKEGKKYYFKNYSVYAPVEAIWSTLVFYDQTLKSTFTEKIMVSPYPSMGLNKKMDITHEIIAREHKNAIFLDAIITMYEYEGDGYTLTSNASDDLDLKVIKDNKQYYIDTRVKQYTDALKAELVANKNIPIKFTSVTKEENSIGTPEVVLIFKNLSGKTIDAFEADVYCYDNYDRPVKHYLRGTNRYGIIYQAEDKSENIVSGEHDYAVWTVYGHDNTTKFKVTLRSVHYTDGTRWRAK